jgi:hypothetical protein
MAYRDDYITVSKKACSHVLEIDTRARVVSISLSMYLYPPLANLNIEYSLYISSFYIF